MIAYLISHPQFYIWNISYIVIFIPHGLIRTHKLPAPYVSGFIAQLVRASHWYREVTGTNPVEVLTFSGFYIRNCINCIHNCEDHSLPDFISAVLYMETFHIHSSRAHYNPQMTGSQRQWLHCSVGWSVAPVSRGYGFKPRWSPDFFRLLYTQLHRLHS